MAVTVAANVSGCPATRVPDRSTGALTLTGNVVTENACPPEFDGRKLASPLALAVITWFPRPKVNPLSRATPAPSKGAVPIVAAPSRNVTVPVGVADEDVTVAVKLTIWPEGAEPEPTFTVVAVAAFVTGCDCVLDVNAGKALSPL